MSPKHDIVTLEQIIRRRHTKRFPDMKQERFFEHFVAEQILKARDLTDEQLLAGNVGGPYDGGIDAIHIFVNGDRIDDTNVERYKNMKEGVKIDLHLIQAKEKNRMEVSVVTTFSQLADDFLKTNGDMSALKGHYNSGVLQAFAWFWDIYGELRITAAPEVNIIFSYATKAGGPTKRMRERAKQLVKKVERFIGGCKCTFEFLGATELLDLSRAKRPRHFDLIAAGQPLSADATGGSYVALVRLDEYFDFITADDGDLHWHLFEANVRDWQGENKVNRQIQDSLRHKDANDFWWLNNGVTILVKSLVPSGYKLRLENPEIVNGLQTTRAIWQHFRDAPAGTGDERRLLTRIIVIGDGNENRETIIQATNSQTAVPTFALRSLDRVHRNIEEYFLDKTENQLFYDRRKNYYKNQGKPAKSIIDLRTLAQAVIATGLGEPDDARGRPSDYLGASDDEKYRMVFDDDTHPAFYLFCARFSKLIDELLKNDKINKEFDSAQRRAVRFHVMTRVISSHLSIAPSQLPKAINSIANLDVDHIDQNMIIDSINGVLSLFDDFRKQQDTSRIKWREFETAFFEDLDLVLQRQ